MIRTTPGRLLIDEALPADLRDKAQVLDKKGVQKLMQEIADRYPDQYRDISHKLLGVGADAGYTSGGYSFGLRHLLPSRAALQIRQQLQRNVDRILANPSLDEGSKEKAIVKATDSVRSDMEKAIYAESLAEKNPLALQIQSGAKGSPTNLRSLRGGDLLYVDQHDKEVPIPVTRSYSEGLTPAQYFAGSFGARRGVVDLKVATQDAGWFGKQLAQAAHRLVVTDRNGEKPFDPEQPRGLPVPTDDPDNEGAFLSAPVGPFPRNTQLTPQVLSTLKSKGFDRILVRSPLVGGPPDGGVYGLDVGVRDRGRVAPVGDFVGITAAQAISEPLTQSSIGSKHSGGVAGTGGGVSGFKLINQLVQIPKTFHGGATHAQLDGRVEDVAAAPQGGHYVTIGGQKHYIAQGQDVHVKQGDTIEAGDRLSSGIPNPAEIVAHKGIGEGRRSFVDQFRSAAKGAGFMPHRRNLELIARGLIDHVKLTEEMGDHVPDDVVPYSALEHSYEPRPGHVIASPRQAAGKFLEQPVLHYSIGTKIRPSVVKEMEQHGVKHVVAHHESPPFEPIMIRGAANLHHDPDWQTRMLGSNLEKNLLRGAHRSDVSDPMGTSYVPALAKGLGFGTEGKVKGWTP